MENSFEKKFYKTKIGKIALVFEITSIILIIISFIIEPILGWCNVTVDEWLFFISDAALYTGLTLALMFLSIYFTAQNYDGPRK